MKNKQDEKNGAYVAIGIVLCLALGLFAGAILFSTHTVEDKICPEVNPLETITETVTIIETVEKASDLDLALVAFLKAVEDEEDEDGNYVDVLKDYNFDELSIRKVFDEYSVYFDGDVTTVNFNIKLRFKEKDESSETIKYNVEVIFEDDEDTLVTVL